MGFESHRAVNAQNFHQARNEKDHIEKILLLPFRAAEDFTKAARNTFDRANIIGDEHGRDACAQNCRHFERCGLDDGAHIAAVHDVNTEHEHEQKNEANCTEHNLLRIDERRPGPKMGPASCLVSVRSYRSDATQLLQTFAACAHYRCKAVAPAAFSSILA